HALARGPGGADALALAVLAHRLVHAIRGGAQRQLAPRDEISLAAEILDRVARLLRDVHLAGVQALDQLVGRGVDEDDFVGLLEHRIGHRLLHAHVRDAGDDVVQALDVLDVDRGADVDARVEELFDVLPALRVPRPRLALDRVAVRELVHEQHLRLPRERRIEVEVAQRAVAVLHLEVRQALEALEQRLGFLPAVRLDIADDHVHALALAHAGVLEHRVGLADAGGRAEENGQLAALLFRLLALHARKKRVRVGADGAHAPTLAQSGPEAREHVDEEGHGEERTEDRHSDAVDAFGLALRLHPGAEIVHGDSHQRRTKKLTAVSTAGTSSCTPQISAPTIDSFMLRSFFMTPR